MKGERIKLYPEMLEGYKEALLEIKEWRKTKPKGPSLEAAQFDFSDKGKLVRAYGYVMLYMRRKRKGNTWDEHAPETELWKRSLEHAIDLAKALDCDHKVWDTFGATKRAFFEGVVDIVLYAAKKAGTRYDDNFGFTAGQLRCVLEHMKKGWPTPLGAR